MWVGANVYFRGILYSLIFASSFAFAEPPAALESPSRIRPIKMHPVPTAREFFADSELRPVIEHSRKCELALSMHAVALEHGQEERESSVTDSIYRVLKEEIAAGRFKKVTHFGAGVAVVKDGKVIAGLRQGGVGDGQWGFPGGKIDHTDGSVFDGIRREVREETSLEIKNLRLLGLTTETMYNPKTQKVETYVSFHFAADWASGDLSVSEEERKKLDPDHPFTWMSWGEIGRLKEPLFPTLKKLYNSGIDPTAPEYH
jgi:8-oxo-dGTP pyrophosphatase MutT (NUDIX family)